MPAASLPYHEPSIEDILILSTFLLALNLANSVLDRTLYCGLVGQVFVGVAWGTPGGGWLSEFMEHAIVQLGNLGLIMIVFEGKFNNSSSGGWFYNEISKDLTMIQQAVRRVPSPPCAPILRSRPASL